MQIQIDHIYNLIKRASDAATPDSAIGYSQAAMNAANALALTQHALKDAPYQTTISADV